MKIVFSDLAKQDLASIEEYTREKWGSYQADIYLAQIENRIQRQDLTLSSERFLTNSSAFRLIVILYKALTCP